MKLEIADVGSKGDGIARSGGETLFVPFTLAGETIRASGSPPHLALEDIIAASPHRISPVCRHFGTCGGCALQHMSEPASLEWKREQVLEAFSNEGLKVDVAACVASPPNARRRVTFTARRGPNGIGFGFHARASEEVVDIEQCPILLPGMESQLDDLRKLTAMLIRGREDVQVQMTSCDNGIDLNFTMPDELPESMITPFVRAFAKTQYLRASASVAGTSLVLVERAKPIIRFGDVEVPVPPGGFLQAVGPIENGMAELVTRHLKKSRTVADLFSGSGTFSLRLAKRSRVHGVEFDQAALDALVAGASEASGAALKPVTVEQRDLHEAPLTIKELSRFDGLCLDPPRAGALDQAREIASSTIGKVAYVSCNPKTLARDAAVLVGGGYRLVSATPFDQFTYTPHVEVVALFEKTTKKPKPIFGRRV